MKHPKLFFRHFLYIVFFSITLFTVNSYSQCKIDVCNCCGSSLYYELLDSANNVIGSWWTGNDGCASNIGGWGWPDGATYHIVTYCPNGEQLPTVYVTGCICSHAKNMKVDLPCCPTSDNNNSKDKGELPKEFKLNQNYPNPFNPSTNISFELSESVNVKLTIYDATGKVILQPISGSLLQPGYHEYVWNTTHDDISSGIYFYKLEAGYFTDQKKMVLVK